MAKEKKQKMKNYPFSKTELIKKYRKPLFFARFKQFFDGLKEAGKAFLHPMVNEKFNYPIVYVWGNTKNGNLYSWDDISIVYNMKEGLYYLCIETALLFSSQEGWGLYLKDLLAEFTKYMEENGLDTNTPKMLFMDSPKIELKAESIEELYTEFVLFVNAFCATYGVDPPVDEDEYDEDFGGGDDTYV